MKETNKTVRRILCYGDSNTWGYTPGTGVRFAPEVRWTGVCQQQLGENFRILEHGLNGRTTAYDDPVSPVMNGLKCLGYELVSQKPLDLVVLMLGTNDMRFVNALHSARGTRELVRVLNNADQIFSGSTPVFRDAPRILVVSPPLLHPQLAELRPDCDLVPGVEESRKFAAFQRQIAQEYGAAFLDAAEYAAASADDGVHIDAQSHNRLGCAIASKICEIFADAE